MKQAAFLAVLVIVAAFAAPVSAFEVVSLHGQDIVAGRAIVVPAADADLGALRADLADDGFRVARVSLRTGQRLPLARWSGAVEEISYLLVHFDPQADHVDALSRLAALSGVAEVWPDRVLYPSWQPNDPYFGSQMNLKQIGLESAWNRTRGDGVIVAVIDTGYLMDGLEDGAVNVLDGWDFANNDDDPTDRCPDMGHGTHVSNTIAEATNNDLGTAGAAPSVTLLPVKVFADGAQGAADSDIVDGINWSVEEGARVMNLSLGAAGGGGPSCSAIAHAVDEGVVVVVASGNENTSVSYPAACADSIAVGSCNQHSPGDLPIRSEFSNYGDGLSVVAPGENIVAETFDSNGNVGYMAAWGTSMASPHVAAVAALLIAAMPELTDAAAIRDVIEETASRDANTDWDPEVGWGEVNAADALEAYAGEIPNEAPTASATATPTEGQAPLTVTFAGGASDPDNSIISYLWSFSNGETYNLPTFEYTFTEPGDYSVLLTVTDELGASGSDTVDIHVTAGSDDDEKKDEGGCAVGGSANYEPLVFMALSLGWLLARRRRPQ